jgi:hypothetical protein
VLDGRVIAKNDVVSYETLKAAMLSDAGSEA